MVVIGGIDIAFGTLEVWSFRGIGSHLGKGIGWTSYRTGSIPALWAS